MTLILVLFFSVSSTSQELTGVQLLEKAIEFHDPNNRWPTFNGEFFVTMKTPKNSDRVSEININLPQEFFSVKATRDTLTTNYIVEKTNCISALNGDEHPSEALKKKYRLDCDRAKMLKNYYTYLYGLPMKLKDEGTIVHPKVIQKSFKGKVYLVLKVNYKTEVGKDTWYFYFDPKTYAMEVYQFFKDEAKNDGEYILLSDLETINTIKIPKIRAWYYNKNDGYLGTDILSKKTN